MDLWSLAVPHSKYPSRNLERQDEFALVSRFTSPAFSLPLLIFRKTTFGSKSAHASKARSACSSPRLQFSQKFLPDTQTTKQEHMLCPPPPLELFKSIHVVSYLAHADHCTTALWAMRGGGPEGLHPLRSEKLTKVHSSSVSRILCLSQLTTRNS